MKIYKTFDEWLDDNYACTLYSHPFPDAKMAFESRQKEIDQLKARIEELTKERNHWRDLAGNWMLDYDKLKNKYEPEVIQE